MKRRILILVYMLIITLFAKMAFNYFYNSYMIKSFEAGDYSVNDNILLMANFDEPYIAHFNNGDVLYQQGLYKEAIEEYDAALKCFPPRLSECPIRINKALAMVGTLGEDFCNVDLHDPDSIQDAIDYLYDAIDVLTEDGCANDKGTGHSRTAEKLKEQIEELIKELEDKLNNPEETPTPTPTPTEDPNSTPTPTEDPNSTPTPTEDPNSTPTPTEDPNSTPTPTEDPNSTPTPTEDPNSTPTPTEDPNSTPTPTEDPNSTPTPITTPEPTEDPNSTPTPTAVPTEEPGLTPTPIPTPSITPEPQESPSDRYEEIEATIAQLLEESARERVEDTQDYYEVNNGSNWTGDKNW